MLPKLQQRPKIKEELLYPKSRSCFKNRSENITNLKKLRDFLQNQCINSESDVQLVPQTKEKKKSKTIHQQIIPNLESRYSSVLRGKENFDFVSSSLKENICHPHWNRQQKRSRLVDKENDKSGPKLRQILNFKPRKRKSNLIEFNISKGKIL